MSTIATETTYEFWSHINPTEGLIQSYERGEISFEELQDQGSGAIQREKRALELLTQEFAPGDEAAALVALNRELASGFETFDQVLDALIAGCIPEYRNIRTEVYGAFAPEVERRLEREYLQREGRSRLGE